MKKITLKTQNVKWLLWLALILLMKLPSIAQNGAVVTGTIVNANGELLQGATIKVSGNDQKGSFTTATNEKGVFVLRQLRAGSTYTFTASYVGYDKNTINSFAVKQGNNSILIRLQPSNNSMDQVVVIGYGTQRRETVTGSIATIKAEDFNKGVIADPVTLITGKVAGLVVTRPNGSDPNATADISLRGANSVEANAAPLVIIDGIIGGDLHTIAPADIASIDILRDGSAASIYGSRATGGVIIITTKRGAPGRTKVSYTGYAATETIAKKYDVLNADQYRKFANTDSIAIIDGGGNTDWFKQLIRTPFNWGHNLSVSGGSGKMTYNASLNYQKYQGIDLSANREFVNGMIRMNTKALNDKLDFSVLLANSFDNKYFAEYYGFGQVLNMNPTFPVYNKDGTFYENTQAANGSQWNPVANTVYNTNNSKEKRLLGNARLVYSLLSGLKAGISYSIVKTDVLGSSYTNSRLLYQQTSGANGTASRSESNFTQNLVETTVEYNKRIKEHSVNVIAGYSFQNQFNEGFGAGNNNFNSNAYLYNSLGSGSALTNLDPYAVRNGVFVNSFANKSVLLSYFGRLVYNFQAKYLFNASIRREGSSKLGTGNKWGNYIGVSAGWIISKEDFLQGSSVIKNLKIRGGYGSTGNQDALKPYQSLATIGPYIDQWGQYMPNAFFSSTGNWVRGYGYTINPNPSLRWETKEEFNAGMDFTLFRTGWLNGTLDLYSRKTKNLIGNYSAQVPSSIYPLTFANAGVLSNKGVELSLNAAIVKRRTFTWNANFVSAYNENKIVSVSNNQFHGSSYNIQPINGYGTEVQRMEAGHSVNEFYGRKFAGFDQTGQWLFYNKSGSKVNSVSDEDYVFLGNSIPKVNLGLTNNFIIGNFDFSVLLRGAFGFKALNAKRIFHENVHEFGSRNLFVSAINNPIKGETVFSSYYLENGNYLKVDNLTLGYTLPIRSGSIDKMRVSVTGTNLFLITKFSGLDPELSVTPFNGSGVEANDAYYPRTRSLTFSVTADF